MKRARLSLADYAKATQWAAPLFAICETIQWRFPSFGDYRARPFDWKVD